MKLPIAPVIHLLHQAAGSTLATLSAQMPGYPYATVVPNVLDEHHRPVLLISALAEHTKNILAAPRVSLSVVEADTTNVQAAARLTLTGDAERFERSESFDPGHPMTARYLRYQPEAEACLELDFMFFRWVPKRVRYIAGIGQMGWFEPDDWLALPSLSLDDETRLLERAARLVPGGVSILGIDCFGIDFESNGRRNRLRFPDGPLRSDSLAEAVGRIAPGLS